MLPRHARCCPRCRHSLEGLNPQGSLFCPACETHYPNRQGVLDFMPGQDDGWGDTNRDEMVRLNQCAEQAGWFAAIRQCFDGDSNRIAYIIDPSRLGWLFHCFDGEANEVCLGLGSGWGALEFPLSRFFETVYSVDDTYELLRFQAIRAAEDSVDNLFILRSPLLRLPLEDNSVDLVLMNDALARVALRALGKDPEAQQSELLQEVNRVLKPNGRIYFGTENRLSALHLLRGSSRGWRERAKAMVTNPKPPREADRPLTTVSERPTYTLSAWGYERLLHRSGFSCAEIYWAWPSSAYPRTSGPLDGESIRYMANRIKHHVDSPWMRLATEAATHVPKRLLEPLLKLFAPHFLIVAARRDGKRTLQAELLANDPAPHSFIRLSAGGNAELKTTFLLLDHNSQVSKAVRVAEDAQDVQGRHHFACHASDGVQGHSIRPHHPAHVRAAASWLADFHHTSMRGHWPAGTLMQELKTLTQTAETVERGEDVAQLLQTYTARYEQLVCTNPLPVTAEHGDYTAPNILMDVQGELKVIDWEFLRQQGNPLMDIGAFCLSLLRNTSKPNLFPTQLMPGTPISQFSEAYGGAQTDCRDWQTCLLLSPTYYLLRLIARIHSQKRSEPVSHLMLSQWLPLLHPMLTFSLTEDKTKHAAAPVV